MFIRLITNTIEYLATSKHPVGEIGGFCVSFAYTFLYSSVSVITTENVINNLIFPCMVGIIAGAFVNLTRKFLERYKLPMQKHFDKILPKKENKNDEK